MSFERWAFGIEARKGISINSNDFQPLALDSITVPRFWRLPLLAVLFGAISMAYMSPMASTQYLSQSPDLYITLCLDIQGGRAFDEGQLPIRTAPKNPGRMAVFQFYSQVPYTLIAIAYHYIHPKNPYAAYRLVIWGLMTFAGWYMCRTVQAWLRSWPVAILAGMVYISAPYLLLNIHVRPALAEASAQCVLPCVLFYALQCYRSGRWISVLKSGVAWALFAMCHTITFFYSSLFIVALMIWVSLGIKRALPRIGRFIAGGIVGGLLAAFTLAPQLIYASRLKASHQCNFSPYSGKILTPLLSLLAPGLIAPMPLSDHPDWAKEHCFQVGWPMLLSWGVVALVVFVQCWNSRNRISGVWFYGRQASTALLALFAVTFFMVWSPVDFWKYLPQKMWIIQGPARILSQVSWVGALLSGLAIFALFGRRLRSGQVAAGILMLGIATAPFIQLMKQNTVTIASCIQNPQIDLLTDMWTIYPTADTKHVDQLPHPLDAIQITQRNEWSHAQVTTSAEKDVMLPLFYYGELQEVRDNGQRVTPLPIQVPGLLQVSNDVMLGVHLPAGEHEITVRFVGLSWANWVSALSWMGCLAGIAALWFVRRRKRRIFVLA